jgi:hypothetical protein
LEPKKKGKTNANTKIPSGSLQKETSIHLKYPSEDKAELVKTGTLLYHTDTYALRQSKQLPMSQVKVPSVHGMIQTQVTN